MIVFSRKYPIQRMLKKRFFHQNQKATLKYGSIGLFCTHAFRFEYRYCLFFRKFFKKFFKKRKRKNGTFCRRKTWIFLRPNYTLTRKSKHARMGKGKGNFKRWCTIIYPGRVFIEHINVSPNSYKKYVWKLMIKLKIQLKVISKNQNTLKNLNPSNNVVSYSNMFTIIKIRRNSWQNCN